MSAMDALLKTIEDEFRGVVTRQDLDSSGMVEFAWLQVPNWDVELHMWAFDGEVEVDLDGCDLLVADLENESPVVLSLLRELFSKGVVVLRQPWPSYMRVMLDDGAGTVISSCGLRLPFMSLRKIQYPPLPGAGPGGEG